MRRAQSLLFTIGKGKEMGKLLQQIECWMNDFKLNKKLLLLYISCVLLPLIATDSVILYTVVHSEQVERQHVMENDANAVSYNFSNTIENVASTAKNIYTNQTIEDFLNRQYETPLEYVVAYNRFMQTSLFNSSIGTSNTQITIYADNETIVNGGEFGTISSIRETAWYRYLTESGLDTMLYCYYDNEKSPAVDAKRRILFIRRMKFFGEESCEKIVKIEIDYSNLVRNLNNMSYQSPVYICQNNQILLSNSGHCNVGQDFEEFQLQERIGYAEELNLYGTGLDIYILKNESNVFAQGIANAPLILFLFVVNIVLPWILMRLINRSFIMRIEELGKAFESVNQDSLTPISNVRGGDEIAILMKNYNRMVKRTNELIQTVYKDKLKEQEMDIAKQNAELLALHSQINPHFLFNALESIRMHSILRQEYETADMVEKLAIMERQNVDWGTDSVEIKREMEFVEAYLGLQKYRFGDRLSYELDVEQACKEIQIPKLTVVTFVENACVHGIESKTAPGWIFVRIFMEHKDLCIEVEDTGDGLDEMQVAELQDKMRNASIERLQEKGRVGMMNACLRIKMVTENKARFCIESEKGVGTTVQIRIPLDKLKA